MSNEDLINVILNVIKDVRRRPEEDKTFNTSLDETVEENEIEEDTELVPVRDIIKLIHDFRQDCHCQLEALMQSGNLNASKLIDILFGQIYACNSLEDRFLEALEAEEEEFEE